MGPFASTSLAVATFNIRYDAGQSSQGADAWLNPDNPRRDRALALITDMAPDLLGVQEALANQVDDLKLLLAQYSFVGVGRDDGERAGEFAGIFYRTARFELIDSGHFWLSETPDRPGTVFEGSGSIRMATWILVLDTAAMRELFMLNTHWDNVSQSSREASANLVLEQLGLLAPEIPTIVTGDLNQAETNVAVQTLSRSAAQGGLDLRDAYREVIANPAPDERTYHDFTGETAGQRIDFVFASPALRATSAKIRTDSFQGRYPSDHFPVIVSFESR
jgi:endonuclease/exonuclease/phosphatase family metal-dependent hydrolase